MSDSTVLKTPLSDRHRELGARMMPFAGYDMPVQYSGLMDEHLAVRERAGLFDVSHMGEAAVEGAQALELLQKLTCNNVAKLKVGRAHYTGLMNEQGAFHDDLLIYRRAEDRFLCVINAANATTDLAWIRQHAEGMDVDVRDESDGWGLLALQGPKAEAILAPHCDADLSQIAYYGFAEAKVDGVSMIVSRTGYTGEDGFELYLPSDAAFQVWNRLLEAGAPEGLLPAGLGARDTLRLEARMALYGNDIDQTTTAYEAGLGWIVKLKKGDFIGREALVRQKEEGCARQLVGIEMEGRAIARHGYEVHHKGEVVGKVTSGTFAPYLKRRIGLAYVPTELSSVGTALEIAVRSKVEPAKVVETPFYSRKK